MVNKRYYLHSKGKYEDYETYSAIIQSNKSAVWRCCQVSQYDVLVYCTDEMTGIQALERESPDKKVLPGMCAKEEINYIRHGTTSLRNYKEITSEIFIYSTSHVVL